jgi:hypothetical protein
MQQIVIPALERFEPELVIVACGYDANAVDPLARMLLHSDSSRMMTRLLRQAAERMCQGRLVLVHEGDYSEAYVPFCGLAALEELSGIRTTVSDPMLEWLLAKGLCSGSNCYVAFRSSGTHPSRGGISTMERDRKNNVGDCQYLQLFGSERRFSL